MPGWESSPTPWSGAVCPQACSSTPPPEHPALGFPEQESLKLPLPWQDPRMEVLGWPHTYPANWRSGRLTPREANGRLNHGGCAWSQCRSSCPRAPPLLQGRAAGLGTWALSSSSSKACTRRYLDPGRAGGCCLANLPFLPPAEQGQPPWLPQGAAVTAGRVQLQGAELRASQVTPQA